MGPRLDEAVVVNGADGDRDQSPCSEGGGSLLHTKDCDQVSAGSSVLSLNSHRAPTPSTRVNTNPQQLTPRPGTSHAASSAAQVNSRKRHQLA